METKPGNPILFRHGQTSEHSGYALLVLAAFVFLIGYCVYDPSASGHTHYGRRGKGSPELLMMIGIGTAVYGLSMVVRALANLPLAEVSDKGIKIYKLLWAESISWSEIGAVELATIYQNSMRPARVGFLGFCIVRRCFQTRGSNRITFDPRCWGLSEEAWWTLLSEKCPEHFTSELRRAMEARIRGEDAQLLVITNVRPPVAAPRSEPMTGGGTRIVVDPRGWTG